MSEVFLSLLVGIFVGIFYWRRFDSYRYGVLFGLWCCLGPDVPKFLISNEKFLINFIGWHIAIIILLLLLVDFLAKRLFRKRYLKFIWFVEIGLVLHLTIDYIFNVI